MTGVQTCALPIYMTPQEFAAFVRGGALQAAPAPIPDFEQEDSAHEEI